MPSIKRGNYRTSPCHSSGERYGTKGRSLTPLKGGGAGRVAIPIHRAELKLLLRIVAAIMNGGKR
jgi:hypothetical protein